MNIEGRGSEGMGESRSVLKGAESEVRVSTEEEEHFERGWRASMGLAYEGMSDWIWY